MANKLFSDSFSSIVDFNKHLNVVFGYAANKNDFLKAFRFFDGFKGNIFLHKIALLFITIIILLTFIPRLKNKNNDFIDL